MREIRFRGKRVDNGEWAYGYFRETQGFDCETLYFIHSILLGECEDYLINPESVSQYTGLKDMNDAEIYEGDICTTDLSRPYLIVVFRNGAFMYQCHDDGKDYFDIMLPTDIESYVDKYTKVIGNIYDNPSLLEVAQ